jgi:hypothetical protein
MDRPASADGGDTSGLAAVNLSLACFPGLRPLEALHEAVRGLEEGWLSEPALGALQMQHVQLVPQSAGVLDEETLAGIREAFPSVQPRLHANVRLSPGQPIIDLARFPGQRSWFAQVARLSSTIGAAAYSAHAGLRRDASLKQVIGYTKEACDLFGVPVGLEGHYPDRSGQWLVSTWSEYRTVLEAGIPFVVDLSHLNIVAAQTRTLELGLTAELLASPLCIEVHLSANDGSGDQHQVCSAPTWWHQLLGGINPDAVIFSEGNHRWLRERERRLRADPEVLRHLP